MTQQEFTKAMTYMGLAYNKEFTPEQVGVWYTFFAEAEYEDFVKAIKRLIIKFRFIPSIADIREEIALNISPDLQLYADEEWEKVQDAIRYYGVYRADEAVKTLHPVTAKTVNRLGGFSKLCRAEDINWVRKDFMQMFDTFMKRERTTQTLALPKREHMALEDINLEDNDELHS